jgi:hypothetical protein
VREDKKIAEQLLLNLLQSWGTPIQKKLETFNEALEYVGIKAKWIQPEGSDNPKEQYIECDEESEGKKSETFLKDIRACFPLGKFEDEERAIANVIRTYREMNVEA